MNISPPPCIAKEEGDILDCYFFAGGNINLDADGQENCKEVVCKEVVCKGNGVGSDAMEPLGDRP